MTLATTDHVHDERVQLAAAWFRENRDQCPRPIVQHLRELFGLSTREACWAIAEANREAVR